MIIDFTINDNAEEENHTDHQNLSLNDNKIEKQKNGINSGKKF